jgi:hypothetical protein
MVELARESTRSAAAATPPKPPRVEG